MLDSESGGSGDLDNGMVESAALHPLMELQRLDVEAAQLHHRREGLALRAELRGAQARVDELRERIEQRLASRVEITTRQRRLEDEASTLEARADRDEARLYSGEISGTRGLQALQEEIAGLRGRQGVLEEAAIAALIEFEELDGEIAVLSDQRASCDERVTVLEAELSAAESEIDERLSELSAQRSRTAADPGGEALGRYEELRSVFGPSTVVSFDPSAGCACPQVMPAAEVARVKRCEPGDLLDCAECGRLVLR